MHRYADNSVAVIINDINPHQKRYSAFDNDKKGTCLLAIDENAVGFCNTSKSKSKKKIGIRIAFSKIGAIVTDIDGNIQYDWKWDRRGRDAGTPPATPISVELNDYLTFKMKDTREDMTLTFKDESTIHTFDIGLKLKRTDTYLDNCTKLPGGHLLPKLEYKSLKNRQAEFNNKMSALRNKNNPKSENLSEMVRGVVAQLEENFDDVSNRMKTSVNFTATWKSEALSSTLSEIPKIRTIGTEIGNISGYGDHIYTSTSENRLSYTAPAILMNASGKWKDETDVRIALKEVNPPLKRSAALQVASGRYSAQQVVDPLRVSVDNPTGMIEVEGKPLESMSWINFKEILASSSLGASSVLFVVLLTRSGDPAGLLCSRIASVVNKQVEHIQSRASSPTSLSARPSSNRTAMATNNGRNKFRLIRIDISENNDADKELGIRSLPNFAMFYGGSMVYAGLLGGRTVKSSTLQSHKPRVLLVEPNFHDQIEIEKSLKRENCDVFLCLTVHQAIDRIQSIDVTNPHPYDIVLISEDIQDQEVGILGQRLAQFTKSRTTVVCALASIMGPKGKEHLNAVSWKQYCTTDVMSVISNPLSKIVSMATQKPLKAAAITKLLSLRTPKNDAMVTGLSPETLLAKMNQVVTQGVVGQNKTFQGAAGSAGYVGIRLSTEDINIRGKELVVSHQDYNPTKK